MEQSAGGAGHRQSTRIDRLHRVETPCRDGGEQDEQDPTRGDRDPWALEPAASAHD